MKVLLAAALMFATITPAVAVDATKLTGESWLGEESCAGGVSEPDCVLSFQITGTAAEQLYKGMKAKAKHDECTDNELKTDANGLRCYSEGQSKYSCDFGYSFRNEKFGMSEMSC